MGGEVFATTAKGTTVQEAFTAAVEHARYEYGHGGYTGTIAEKDEFVEFAVPEGMSLEDFVRAIGDYDLPDSLSPSARKTVERAQEVHDDKWGPAVAVKVGPDEWLFCGVASS